MRFNVPPPPPPAQVLGNLITVYGTTTQCRVTVSGIRPIECLRYIEIN